MLQPAPVPSKYINLYIAISILYCGIVACFRSHHPFLADRCKKIANMGNKASIIPTTSHINIPEECKDSDTTPDLDKTSKETHIEHMIDKQRRKEKWRKILAEYKSQVLDTSYLVPSVRGNTVVAAAQYPQSVHVQQKATLMPGTHKHLGGAYDPTDGCIYGVPANARAVLCLYPSYLPSKECNTASDSATAIIDGYRMTTIPLPESIASCNYKWLRGIFAHGYLWAIPAWANCVLCVDVDAFWKRRPVSDKGIVQLLPLPSKHVGIQWQWHGAGINHEKTAIYCIPSNAKHVLKVDLLSKATSLIPVDGYDPMDYPNFSIDTTNKWYGGIVGRDNCVYGIPYRTCAVLKIDCTNDTATLIGPDYGTTKYNWHGGIQVHGKIYAHPSHANTVLVIDTNIENRDKNNNHATSQCSEIPIVRATYDTDPTPTYKWLGGSVGLDGNIYCPDCDTSSVLKIDVTTNTCTTFGHTGTLKNKWQGGILGRDGCIYCIPASGLYVCRISTDPSIINGEKPIQLLGPLSSHKDKWQGGHVGKDGCLYFIPENGYRVLKVTPPEVPPMITDGKLPDGDVTLELL
jgi:hypothetical protein